MGNRYALKAKFELADGIARTDNFDLYDSPRQRDVPNFSIELIESEEPPSGAAEAALAPVAAAIANGVFAARGRWRRTLPIATACVVPRCRVRLAGEKVEGRRLSAHSSRKSIASRTRCGTIFPDGYASLHNSQGDLSRLTLIRPPVFGLIRPVKTAYFPPQTR